MYQVHRKEYSQIDMKYRRYVCNVLYLFDVECEYAFFIVLEYCYLAKFVGHQVGICCYFFEAEWGCVIVQVTSHCPVTAEAQALSQASLCGMSVAQDVTGRNFSSCSSISPVRVIPLMLHTYSVVCP